MTEAAGSGPPEDECEIYKFELGLVGFSVLKITGRCLGIGIFQFVLLEGSFNNFLERPVVSGV